MKRTKRIISLVLAMAILVAMLPAAALADAYYNGKISGQVTDGRFSFSASVRNPRGPIILCIGFLLIACS